MLFQDHRIYAMYNHLTMKYFSSNQIKHALYMSAITIGCFFLMEVTGQNKSFDGKSPFQMLFMFVAPFVVWTMGIGTLKKNQNGKLTFKQGLFEGYKISLLYGILSPFIFAFYYLFINPTIVESVRDMYGLKNMSLQAVIGIDMIAQFISSVVFGTIYSAIISYFLKKK